MCFKNNVVLHWQMHWIQLCPLPMQRGWSCHSPQLDQLLGRLCSSLSDSLDGFESPLYARWGRFFMKNTDITKNVRCYEMIDFEEGSFQKPSSQSIIFDLSTDSRRSVGALAAHDSIYICSWKTCWFLRLGPNRFSFRGAFVYRPSWLNLPRDWLCWITI